MEQQSVLHNTFVIELNYPVPPERVFDAFADPVKKRRWFVDGGGNQVEPMRWIFEWAAKSMPVLATAVP